MIENGNGNNGNGNGNDKNAWEWDGNGNDSSGNGMGMGIRILKLINFIETLIKKSENTKQNVINLLSVRFKINYRQMID